MPGKIAAGNWKMNGAAADLDQIHALANTHRASPVDILICPPATLLTRACKAADRSILIGAQDCHPETSGAHTGDISAQMLKDAGATHVIVGHSERRTDHQETDDIVLQKAAAAHAHDLVAIICIGESLTQRDANITLDIISEQMLGSIPETATAANTIVAYEPIWAIGTGLTPSTEQIAEVHRFMRNALKERFGSATGDAIALLYGGSVKATNATDIFAVSDVDGALVGGASLTASDFSPIVLALEGA